MILEGVIMEGLRKLNKWLCDIFLLVGGIALILMMAVSCLNMLLMTLSKFWPHHFKPWGAAYETVAFLGALVVSLPLAYAQLQKSHIAVDILSKLFPNRLRKLVTGIGYILGILFFAAAGWKVFAHANTLWAAGEVSDALGIPYFPVAYGVALGCILMMFCLFVNMLEIFATPKEDGK
ncbi:TRAP transporter small permease [Thermodesulfobacteriota bacterium]